VVIDRPEIPLHTNGSENDILCHVKSRKVSSGTRSDLASDQTLLVASAQNESAPETEALPNFNRSEPQAATLVGLTSRSLLELAIGIDRGFIASGMSRTRSTCRSPFSRLAPLTLT
jgi:hypothetical protein